MKRASVRLLIIAVAAIAAIGLTVSLGNWQLRRAADKAALQSVRDQARSQPAIEFRPGQPLQALLGRRLRFSGQIDMARTVFLDNRSYKGVAGFHVISPIRVSGSEQVVMLLRGWVPGDPAHRYSVPALAAMPADQTYEGIVEAGLEPGIQLGLWQPGSSSERIWPRFDPDEYQRWSGLHPYPWIVRQDSGTDDGLVRDWVRPGDGVDRHKAYAFQWYTMACALVLLWLWYGIAAWRRAGGADERPDELP